MNTWSSKYKCTDCGKDMERPGTCSDCLIANNPVPEKLKDAIRKTKPGKVKVKK